MCSFNIYLINRCALNTAHGLQWPNENKQTGTNSHQLKLSAAVIHHFTLQNTIKNASHTLSTHSTPPFLAQQLLHRALVERRRIFQEPVHLLVFPLTSRIAQFQRWRGQRNEGALFTVVSLCRRHSLRYRY